MNYDQKFRENLNKCLTSNFIAFVENSIKFIKSVDKDYKRIIGYSISKSYPDLHRNIENGVTVLEKIKVSPTLPMLIFRSNFDDNFSNNEVSIAYDKPPAIYTGMQNFEELSRNIRNDTFLSIQEFYSSDMNEITYQALQDFDCFDNSPKPLEEAAKYKKMNYIYNVSGWKEYLKSTILYWFNGFSYNPEISSEKTLRFTKGLNNDLLLMIEYNLDKVEGLMKNGHFPLSENLTISLVNSRFKAKNKYNLFASKLDENALSFGILGNPFFYKPSASFAQYSALETMKYLYDPSFKIDTYKITYEIDNINKKLIVIHPEKTLGEKLKKYTFFYFHLLSVTSESYLQFLEKSVIQTYNLQ